jgi:hypothetical protein
MKRLWLSGALLLSAVALSGCGRDHKTADMTVTPPAMAAFVDQFGSATGFGSIFRVTANSEPRDVAAGDVAAVSLTTEPVSLP